MVSLWPWKKDDTSAASFEKTLSTLTEKIKKTSIKNDRLRQNARRVKAMWTLYTLFAYILAALIMTLVTGWRNWGPVEYTTVAGGPLLIYAVRTAITSYYNYRISRTQAFLESLEKNRDATIEKLKDATKYNATQQLLEKYGTVRPPPPRQASASPESRKKSKSGRQSLGPQSGRTNLPPPPTANIPRSHGSSSAPSTPQRTPAANQSPRQRHDGVQQVGSQPRMLTEEVIPGAEFAPNAYSAPAQYTTGEPKWYDRFLDILLGEDETQPRNRVALICSNCRLVLGQAPPGVKTLEEVGRWRCGGCGAWNGEENATQKLVESLSQQAKAQAGGETASDDATDNDGGVDVLQASEGSHSEMDSAEDGEESKLKMADEPEPESKPPAKSTRSKTKAKKK